MRRILLASLVLLGALLAAPRVRAADAPATTLWAPCPTRASQHRLIVRFTLASMTPASIELADVAGRTLGRWPAPAGVMGPQEMDIGREITVRPGLYLVRLAQGGRSLTATVVVRP